MENPFVLPRKEYRRDINVLAHYIRDTATYISIMSDKPLTECLSFVKESLKPGGDYAMRDPQVSYLGRDENEDRTRQVTTLSEYIGSAIKEKDLIAPTLTTYINPAKKESLLVRFIDENVKLRGVFKKAMFVAKQAGDKKTFALKKCEQVNKKLNNNSISGAHCSGGTPFYNKTAHSTLTSNCRTTSGYGNANNEKFLCGNRHYWSPDIVRNNIISIINNTDYDKLKDTMLFFGIRAPSVAETIACYKYSTDLYWKGDRDHALLAILISKLTELQRSAFVYTGDLYHLMKYNDNVARVFIGKLSAKATEEHPNPKEVIKNASEDIVSLATQICSDGMRGMKLFDIEGTSTYGILASTVENISNVLQEYFFLIRNLWVTPNVPASVSLFPQSIRRAAITSDTDSTIFTVQDWVIWHEGKLTFDERGIAVAATMIFLAAQGIIHILARMSANFGIEEKRVHQVAMKNEFFFPVFVPTDLAKHYYALISCQEGNVFKEFEREIKGVHLKSSNAPKEIIKDAEKMMIFILKSIANGEKISIKEIIKWIADKEREVMASIKNGDNNYFRRGQIKNPGSYKNGEKTSAYMQYLMWEEVFADKYGHAPPPPYQALKVGMSINKPTLVREWLEAIEDKEIVAKLEKWLSKTDKTAFGGVLLLPEQIISGRGIPEEILQAIGARKIIYETTSIYYTILETLGIDIINKQKTCIASDLY